MEQVRKIQLWRRIGGDILEKGAELSETYDMTSQQREGHKRKRSLPIRKTASAEVSEDTTMELPECCQTDQPKKLPQMGALKPHVDVSSHEPPKVVQEKKAEHYALPAIQMYPLDNYLQVKEAARYFMDTWKFMEPGDRHEYCGNLVKRASALNIVTDQLIEKYGSATYAPECDIEVCLDARRSNILDDTHKAVLNKLAQLRFGMQPEQWAVALEEFDKTACLRQHYGDIPDAYYTTFGKTAAQGNKEDPKAAVVIGNEYITRRRLSEYLTNNVSTIKQRFGADVAEEMAKDPESIFDSLPRDQKLVIMRMANNDDSPVQQAEQSA
jgi:hypothetical protein